MKCRKILNKDIFGVVTVLGKNRLKSRRHKHKLCRSVVLKSKCVPPGCDYRQQFKFGRHQKNDFVIHGEKGIKAWVGRFQFSIMGDPDTLRCELLNGCIVDSKVTISRNSCLQIKYPEQVETWMFVEPGNSIPLRDKTLFRIRGATFLFTSNTSSLTLEVKDHSEADARWVQFTTDEAECIMQFDCCDHRVSKEAAEFWSTTTLPFREDFRGSACPLCMKSLQGCPGYVDTCTAS